MKYEHLLVFLLLLFIITPLYGQYALEFDGVDDYVEVPPDYVFEFKTQITAEVWFLVEYVPPYSTHVLMHKWAAPYYSTFSIFFRDGDLQGAFVGIGEVLSIPGGTIELGVWNHVAITYDGAAVRMFLNGFERDISPASGYIHNDYSPISFGRYDSSFGQYYDGSLDEARLWNVSRTGDEIRATMNTEIPGNEVGLIGYWRFNEGIGDTTFDSSPFDNSGLLGAFAGPDSCDPVWITHEIYSPIIFLNIAPIGPTTLPISGILEFSTYIENNRETTIEGDYWLSVLLPDSSEFLIPESLLNYSNPLHGQVFGNSNVDLSNQLFIPTRADTGSYQLIGRIGHYPDGIVDEDSFEFQVVE